MIRVPLVLAGLVGLAGCQALQTADRGLYQAVEMVSENDRVTGRRSLSLADRNAQIRQGNQYIEQLLAEERQAGRKLNGELDRAQYQRLVRLFDRIQRISHLRQERWQPLLIDRDSFNAFTTGGTYIVVHLGLMEQLPDDDEVAAVVGHEIAHTVANHVGESQGHRIASQLSGSKAARSGAYQAAFTHENEREADRIGILYSALAGFDPYAASRIWQRQYLLEGNARALMLHDHPVNAERAEEARQVAAAVASYYRPGQQNPHYEALLENNALWQAQQPGPEAGAGGGVLALLSTVTDTWLQHEQAKAEAARQQQRSAFVKAVEARMTLLESRTLAGNRLQTRWQYRASAPPLNQLVIGLLVQQGEQLSRHVAHIDGVVRPNGQFVAEFNLPETLPVQDLPSLPVRFYVDDVVPAQ
ncbi:M48 family metallopeptidase [Marinobacterium sp. CAU 1594]|nr:M48 family metallopeptidase [Marinobacterium arenosum]